MPSFIFVTSHVDNAMHHRYGRHGPRAWLQQRMRRYARPSLLPISVESPSVVPATTTIRVFVPTTAERIIFIIMQGTINPEDEDEFIESQLGSSHALLLQNTDEMRKLLDSLIVRIAKNQAREDADDIEELTDDNFVRIHWNKVKRETRKLARKAINENYSGKETPDDYEYDRLIEEYQKAYLKRLEDRLDELHKKGASIDYFETRLESQLRDLAIADRKKAPQPPQRPYHQRDLAVVRVLVLLEVSLDIDDDHLASHLADIHTWADKYEHYYRNPREEVNWPECRELFRTSR
jgi:hypothetical protein